MNLDRYGPIAKLTLSALVMLTFIANLTALFALAYYKIELPPGVKEVLLIVEGVLLGMVKEAFSYWFGSSHGSTRKTEMANAAAGLTSGSAP